MILPYRDFIIRDAGGPRDSLFYVITTTHAVIGFFAFVFGNFVVLRGNNLMIPALKIRQLQTLYANRLCCLYPDDLVGRLGVRLLVYNYSQAPYLRIIDLRSNYRNCSGVMRRIAIDF